MAKSIVAILGEVLTITVKNSNRSKVDLSGLKITNGTGTVATLTPEAFNLRIIPNPTSSSTTISYILPNRSHVEIAVFNVLGARVIELANGEEEAGSHVLSVEVARTKIEGTYFVRMEVNGLTTTRRIVIER